MATGGIYLSRHVVWRSGCAHSLYRSFGELASVQDLPVPTADAEVLIRVRFAGVNPLDNNLLGRLTATSSYPFVVGIDFAGVAERVPAEPMACRPATGSSAWRGHTVPMPSTPRSPLPPRWSRWPYPRRRRRRPGRALPIPAVTALRTVDCSRSPRASTSW